jgi:hypothetical protein
VLVSGCKQLLTVHQLLLSHLKTLSAVTQTVGSMHNGRVVNDGLAAPAPL